MKILRKILSVFSKKETVRDVATPSLTILMAIDMATDDKKKCEEFLKEQAQKIDFLSPKTVLVDVKDYQTFIKKDLDKAFRTDFVLLVQKDGMIVNPSAWTNEFFNYDYIGAPWQSNAEWLISRLNEQKKDATDLDFFVGGGAFSLRSKRLCKFVCKHFPEDTRQRDDACICTTMRDSITEAGMKFAPHNVAKMFAVERDEYAGQFGANKWVTKDGKRVAVKDL